MYNTIESTVPTDYRKYFNNIYNSVIEASKASHIDPAILLAIIKVESNFNPFACNVNTNGSLDKGLMQINSKYWADGFETVYGAGSFGRLQSPPDNNKVNYRIYNPEENIMYGAIAIIDNWSIPLAKRMGYDRTRAVVSIYHHGTPDGQVIMDSPYVNKVMEYITLYSDLLYQNKINESEESKLVTSLFKGKNSTMNILLLLIIAGTSMAIVKEMEKHK